MIDSRQFISKQVHFPSQLAKNSLNFSINTNKKKKVNPRYFS